MWQGDGGTLLQSSNLATHNFSMFFTVAAYPDSGSCRGNLQGKQVHSGRGTSRRWCYRSLTAAWLVRLFKGNPESLGYESGPCCSCFQLALHFEQLGDSRSILSSTSTGCTNLAAPMPERKTYLRGPHTGCRRSSFSAVST